MRRRAGRALDDEKMLRELDEHVWEIFQASQGRLLTSHLKDIFRGSFPLKDEGHHG
ncbi:MAG: hypothetical protein ACREX9_22300 [Gammaproteobacteria bacterium]